MMSHSRRMTRDDISRWIRLDPQFAQQVKGRAVDRRQPFWWVASDLLGIAWRLEDRSAAGRSRAA